MALRLVLQCAKNILKSEKMGAKFVARLRPSSELKENFATALSSCIVDAPV